MRVFRIERLLMISELMQQHAPLQEKTDLFVRTRAAFGRTALLLSGGGGLGIFHFGVLKVCVCVEGRFGGRGLYACATVCI